MNRHFEELQRHQARIDAVKRSMPASPTGKPVMDVSELDAPAKAAREAIATAQADVDAAQAELTRARAAHDKATQNANDLRAKAWINGQKVDFRKVQKELDAAAHIATEIDLTTGMLEYKQRVLRDANNKLVALAVALNWLRLSIKRDRASEAVRKRIDAELAEKDALEMFETARFIFHDGFRSYLEADMTLAKVAL